ncbi:MAG: type II toxin-antitoxin system VapB family antitoxin [Verrucomicrobia bacterium]|nr:MAG: type II toxin-antitoxin system VapB family antitoxin [Verrucomicrobiota bacterium]
MATNLDIDQSLLKEAVTVGRHRSKKAAVTEALQEYVARHKQQQIVELFGTVEYSEDYDYRKHRKQA